MRRLPPLPVDLAGPLALLLLWIVSWSQVARDWVYDESYQYGWLVPLLAAYLGWGRMQSLSHLALPLASAARPGRAYHAIGILWIMLAVLILPVGIIRMANPDWRMVGWALSLIALAASWLWLWQAGGPGTLRHFGFPFAFALVAVPWPTQLERLMADSLMPLNAALAVECLHWLGFEATRLGNVIALPAGRLGVEDACSGIRSLQATLMIALFLGELNRLSLSRRGLILALALILATLTNTLRIVGLALLAGRSGVAAADEFHTTSGWIALGVNLGVLLVCARPAALTQTGLSSPPPPACFWKSMPWKGPALCAASQLVIVPIVGAFWFTSPPPTASPPLRLPTREAGFTPLAVSAPVTRMLRQDEGWQVRWQPPGFVRAEALYFRWNAGTIPPGHFRMHRPENCLVSAGLRLEKEDPPLEVNHSGHRYHFRVLRFSDGGTPVTVLYDLTNTNAVNSGQSGGWDGQGQELTPALRLGAAWHGWRNPVQTLVELGFWGDANPVLLQEAARQFLEQATLRPATIPSPP